MPYGEKELGFALVSKYKQSKAKLIIMKEHGEVFIGVKNVAYAVAVNYIEKSYDAQRALSEVPSQDT